MKKIFLVMLLTIGLVSASMAITHAQIPQETLNKYITDLQNSPDGLCTAGKDNQTCADDETKTSDF